MSTSLLISAAIGQHLYQDWCPWNLCILTRTYVLGIFICLPGLMSLEYTYTYQDWCPWNPHLLTRTYVLGIYIYLPGLMSLEYTYTYQDWCPWNPHLLTRTYVLGIYIYLPGLMSLEYTYTYQDLCPWSPHLLTRTYVLGTNLSTDRHSKQIDMNVGNARYRSWYRSIDLWELDDKWTCRFRCGM